MKLLQKICEVSLKICRIITLLQKPCIQGVPSARISAESTGEQVSLMLDLQHRLQAFSTERKKLHFIEIKVNLTK